MSTATDLFMLIKEDMYKMDIHELGKVYKYIRTNIIADLPANQKIQEVDQQKPTANIDYTAALEVELKQMLIEEKGIFLTDDNILELAARLNSAVNKQHCA